MERFKQINKNKRKRYLIISYIFFVVCFFVPSSAYAYLDPGTGNALVYVAVSLLGAVFYFVKGIVYKVMNQVADENEHSQISVGYEDIVIFCEGKSYWNVFKPVVEKLIEKKQHFSYYTMDRKDPCLFIDNQYIENRYIGSGNSAYAKIGNLKANLVLVTTPNIGTKGYPIPRSKGIRKLIYMPHSFGDIAFLHRGALDNYDTFMLTGEFQIRDIRKLEEIRKLPRKELWPAGLPFFEKLIKEKSSYSNSCFDQKAFDVKKENVTVLLAPSWGEKGFLSYYGSDFITALADKGFSLILRPHPQSLKVEKKLIKKLERDLQKYSNIVWDFGQDMKHSFDEADILISEVSGIRFEFAMACRKPFITLPVPIPEEMLNDFEIADLGSSWIEQAMQDIGFGYTVKENEIDSIDKIIKKVLAENKPEAIEDFRKENIYYWGHSDEVIADFLITMNNGFKEKQDNKV